MTKEVAKLLVGDRWHELLTNAVTLGRNVENMIVIDDESVSSHHADIHILNGQHVLRDVGSTNGTKVNGATIQEALLKNGDTITFGMIEGRFAIERISLPVDSWNRKTMGEQLASATRAAGAGFKTAAQIAKKQAERQKVGIVELRKADIAIGKRAFAEKLFSDDYQTIHGSINSINEDVESRSQQRPMKPEASLGERAKNAALHAKDLGLLEASLLKREQLFQTLGANIRNEHPECPELNKEISEGISLANKHMDLQKEIEFLGQSTHPLARHPWLLLGAVIMLLAILGISIWGKKPGGNVLAARTVKEQSEAVATRVIGENKKINEKIKAKLANSKRETEQANLEKESAKKMKLTADAKKKEEDKILQTEVRLKREEATRLENEKRTLEKQKREEQAVQAEMVIAEKKAAVKLEAAASKEAKQKHLWAYAEQAFKGVNLRPDVILAPSLERLGSTIEVKGEPLQKVMDLMQKSDWLGLYNYLENSDSRQYDKKEFPDESGIEYAVQKLKQIRLHLVLKTSFKPIEGQGELIAQFAKSFHLGHLSFDRVGGKAHPDAVGYVYEWSPEARHVCFLIGNDQTSSKFSDFSSEHRNQADKIEAKFKLTEISKAQRDQALQTLERSTLDSCSQWVSGQLKIPDSAAQKRFSSIAKYSQGIWTPLANGLKSTNGRQFNVRRIAHLNGDTYVSGYESHAAHFPESATVSDIARWTGNRWVPVEGLINGCSINEMTAFDGKLCVAGRIQLIDSRVFSLASWDGKQWHELGGSKRPSPRNLSALDDGLYLGDTNCLQRWNGKDLQNMLPVGFNSGIHPEAFSKRNQTLIFATSGIWKTPAGESRLWALTGEKLQPLHGPEKYDIKQIVVSKDVMFVLGNGLQRYSFTTNVWGWDSLSEKQESCIRNAKVIALFGNSLAVASDHLFLIKDKMFTQLPVEIKNIEVLSANGDSLYVGGGFSEIRFLRPDGTPE